MQVQEFTRSENTGYVESANKDSSLAQIDDIERRAKASVTTAKEETARADSFKEKSGGPEAKLYGDLTLEALLPGMKGLAGGIEILDTRRTDAAALKNASNDKSGSIVSKAVSIEDDIAGTMRKPGSYRAPVAAKEYETPSATTGTKMTFAGHPPSKGEDLMTRSKHLATSLNDQPEGTHGALKGTEKKMASVEAAKKLTFGQELASEQALESTIVARQNYHATMGHAKGMAPSLGSGPSINPATLLREAEQNRDDRWNSGGDTA